MGCFAFLKAKPKSRKKQMTSGSEAAVVSTATASSSNYETSRSYDSAGGKQATKSSVSTSSQRSISAMFEEKASVLRVFELAELRSATNNFNRTLKIGEGGFGSVYKGFLKPLDEKSGRITVAVKALNQRSLQVLFGLLFNLVPFCCLLNQNKKELKGRREVVVAGHCLLPGIIQISIRFICFLHADLMVIELLTSFEDLHGNMWDYIDRKPSRKITRTELKI